MKKEQWKFKIGGNAQGLIPSLFLLAVSGGSGILLYRNGNGAYLFSLFFSVLMIAILLAVVYRAAFFKVLIYKDGIFYQAKPGGGAYYKFNQIKKAWQSFGMSTSGVTYRLCCIQPYEGKPIKFSFFPCDSDAVDYLIEHAGGGSSEANSENYAARDWEEYTIDGKSEGIFAIAIVLVLLVVSTLIGIPLLLREAENGFWAAALCIACGISFPLSLLIQLIIRYCCFTVRIETTGFYFRTNPFNGKFYSYSDIESCREELKVSHGGYRHGSGSSYRYFFIFTDKSGKTAKFQFGKGRHGHEINVLKERIGSVATGASGFNSHIGVQAVKWIFSVLFLAALIFVTFFWGTRAQKTIPAPASDAFSSNNAPDFHSVHTVLSNRKFETANRPTTYWFYGKNKLSNVVSGVKNDIFFEFYEYTDGETTDSVYNRISYDLSPDMEPDERDRLSVVLPCKSGKLFTLKENGILSIVAFWDNTVVYAHSPETSTEIEDILFELGYCQE